MHSQRAEIAARRAKSKSKLLRIDDNCNMCYDRVKKRNYSV